MAKAELFFIRRSAEFLDRNRVRHLKNGLRGIYVLYKFVGVEQGKQKFDARYVGMSAGNRFAIKGRLRAHARSKRKKNEWTHFSVFEVWDNITDQQIAELEGFARHVFRRDPIAKGTMNIQRGYQKIRDVKVKDIGTWN
jgi:hypothetical protein